MVEFKFEQSYLKEIGFGPLSGSYQDIMSMENGQQVDRLILCKAEVMLTIQKSLEEELTLLDQPFIGVLIGNIISFQKLMPKNLCLELLSMMISTFLA